MNAAGQTQVHTERTIAERSRLLLEIDNAIVSHLELAPLLKSISECLRRELPHDFAGLVFYDHEIRQLRLHSLDFSSVHPHFALGQIVPIGIGGLNGHGCSRRGGRPNWANAR